MASERFQGYREVYSLWHLRQILSTYGIDTSEWVKSPEKLFSEIEAGEVRLHIEEDRVVQHLQVSNVIIFSPDGSQVLEENYHVRKSDGLKTKRTYFRRSVTEKIRLTESPMMAACRGLKEELELEPDPASVVYTRNSVQREEDLYYLGLLFNTEVSHYMLTLQEELYNPQGYIEQQPKKTVYFNWFPV